MALTIHDLGIKQVNIITVAKVASASFLHGLQDNIPVHHGHSLKYLREVIENNTNQLIITGCRMPVTRNISYFFQTYADNYYNGVQTRNNKYEGEYCYLFDQQDILKKSDEEVIRLIRNSPFNKTYYDWFDEFFDITGLSNRPFNRQKGYSIFEITNNNYVLLYTFEKLQENTTSICNFLGIKELPHVNNLEEKNKEIDILYKRIRNKVWSDEEVKMFNNCKVVNYFYQ